MRTFKRHRGGASTQRLGRPECVAACRRAVISREFMGSPRQLFTPVRNRTAEADTTPNSVRSKRPTYWSLRQRS